MNLLREILLLIKCYPIAKQKVLEKRGSDYAGVVLTQIAYQEVRTELFRKGVNDSDITGAVIYLAISLAYILNK
jgi:inactivated superfamily I helicase